jgi:hypothetical protein
MGSQLGPFRYKTLWELYAEIYGDFAEDEKQAFMLIFGPEFVHAYTELSGDAPAIGGARTTPAPHAFAQNAGQGPAARVPPGAPRGEEQPVDAPRGLRAASHGHPSPCDASPAARAAGATRAAEHASPTASARLAAAGSAGAVDRRFVAGWGWTAGWWSPASLTSRSKKDASPNQVSWPRAPEWARLAPARGRLLSMTWRKAWCARSGAVGTRGELACGGADVARTQS